MKTVILDFDGTIADSFETLLAIFEGITGRRLSRQEVEKISGESLKDIVRQLKLRRWQLPWLVIKARRLLDTRMPDIKIFPGMAAALKQLDAKGCQMFILSTNDPRNIAEFLKANGLAGYFSGIYGNIGLRSKASALKRIIKKEHLNRAECVYVGDEIRDILAAKKSEVISVGVIWGFNNAAAIKNAGPDFIARKPAELTKYLID